MKFLRSLIPLLVLCIALPSCMRQSPSPEDVQKIAALKTELEQVRSEIAAAEDKDTSFAGGLVNVLVEARLEILKTTEALIQQRIHALESGAKITVEVPSTEPDEKLAARLEQEIELQLTELNKLRQKAAKYDGGLVAFMKHATVATQEQSIAMLRQRYLAAKYGLPTVVLAASADTTSEQGTPSASPSTPPSTSHDYPADVNAEIISVKLLRKQYTVQGYQEYIWFNIEFTAKGLDKPARAIKGILNLQDLFGEPHMRLNHTINKPIKPGQTIVEKGTGFEYNQYIDSHQWVRGTDLKDMTASFKVRSILYRDGTRLDF